MIFQEVEQILTEENGFEKTLAQLQESFMRVEEISEELKDGGFSDGEAISKLLLESTGYWEQLNIVYTTLDTIKTKRELGYYHSEKIRIESDPKAKFADGALKQEASNAVMEERRIRNVVKSYVDACDRNITSCQSFLKYLTESQKRTQG